MHYNAYLQQKKSVLLVKINYCCFASKLAIFSVTSPSGMDIIISRAVNALFLADTHLRLRRWRAVFFSVLFSFSYYA
jgi:hypothetical protein